MTAQHIEVALSRWQFPDRTWIVVPRVSWGLNVNECDLLALSKSGYAHSVEIKVSMSDLRREFKKRKYLFQSSEEKWFKARWFAVPLLMREKSLPLIPCRFGVLGVNENGSAVERVRLPEINRKAMKWPPERVIALARNGMIKYWSMRYRHWEESA